MDKSSVIRHFGSVTAVTKALRLSSGYVSLWGDVPPLLQQYRLEKLTDGKLKADDPFFKLQSTKESGA